jgi:integrase
MPSVLQDKVTKRWRARVKRTLEGPNGPVVKRWSKTFHTKAAARDWGLRLEDLIDGGGDPDAPDPRAPAPTVGEWHERWWAARVAEPTTLAANESRLNNHVLPRWKKVPVDQVRPLEVQAWVRQLEKSGLAPATISSCHQLLRRMMAAAMVEGLRPDDPCAHTRLPTIPRGRETYWSREQVDAIVAKIPGQQEQLIVLTLAYTGLRWGELCGLRVGALDLLRRTLRVVRVETRHGPKEYPKSGAGRRTVGLPVWLAEALAGHVSNDRQRLVFANARGGPLSGHNFRNRIWVPALAEARVEVDGKKLRVPDGHVHDLRHTYASWLVQAGRPLEEVKVLLGHESVATTERYSHFRPDHGIAAASVLERARPRALDGPAK